MATPEAKVKKAIRAYLKSIGCWSFMPVSNGMGMMGIPDIIGCLRGHFVAIECKAPGKKGAVTELQQSRIDEINAAGGIAFVADCVEDAIKGLALGILRVNAEKNPT